MQSTKSHKPVSKKSKSTTHLRALNDHVILEVEEHVPSTGSEKVDRIIKEGTIKIPETYEGAVFKVSPFGSIVAYGSRCHYQYEIGQRVFFRQFASTKLQAEHKDYRVIKEDDLIALCED